MNKVIDWDGEFKLADQGSRHAILYVQFDPEVEVTSEDLHMMEFRNSRIRIIAKNLTPIAFETQNGPMSSLTWKGRRIMILETTDFMCEFN